MKTKDKTNNNKDKDKKIILWEVKSFPAIKIISPRHEDIPEINNPKIRFPKLEGDKLMKEVLNGGYNVHPVPPPNSEKQERIMKRYETKRIKIEKLLPLFIIIRR